MTEFGTTKSEGNKLVCQSIELKLKHSPEWPVKEGGDAAIYEQEWMIETLTDIMSHVMRKPTFCICKNKGADQLRSYCKADHAAPLFSLHR